MVASNVVIGMLGMGVVGGGAVELLSKFPNVQIKKILVRDTTKPRCTALPAGCELTTDLDAVLNDEAINVIVEVMGGTGDAWRATKHAIEAGKHVVTANKALISKYMTEITAMLADRPNQMFMYEAAVCGGVPIISAIARSMLTDEVSTVSGIMNGTANFMLTEMKEHGASYQEALKDAQERGFAEADPAADVDGFDARSKLCILTRLAFGCVVDEAQVFTQGISVVTAEDLQLAAAAGLTVKQISVADRGDSSSDAVSVMCSPAMVDSRSRLASVDGVTNAVEVASRNLGKTFFAGPGAGRLPSANSVANDVLSVARSFDHPATAIPAFPARKPTQPGEICYNISAKFCLRTVEPDEAAAREVSDRLAMKGLDESRAPVKVDTEGADGRRTTVMHFLKKCSLRDIQDVAKSFETRTCATVFPLFE